MPERREQRGQRREQDTARGHGKVVSLAQVGTFVRQDSAELGLIECCEQAGGDDDAVASPADAEGIRCGVVDDEGSGQHVGASNEVEGRDARGPFVSICGGRTESTPAGARNQGKTQREPEERGQRSAG
jgi:hypothetical protein